MIWSVFGDLIPLHSANGQWAPTVDIPDLISVQGMILMEVSTSWDKVFDYIG